MISKFRAVATAVVLSLTGPALADGVDPLYDQNGNYIGDVEIVGDVFNQSGVEFARLDIPSMRMTLYVDPEAVYVTLTQDNPIIQQQTPFYGYWIGWDPDPSGLWSACDYDTYPDHTGRQYRLYGDLVWTNLSLSNNWDLEFAIDIGHCGGPVVPWVTNQQYQYNAPPPPPNNPASYDPWDLNVLRDICGNDPDLTARAMGCTRIIAHPESSIDDVTSGYWTRAYVRCGSVPDPEIIADLMSAVWLDPYTWQEYFRDVSGYRGPIDGQISYELVQSVNRYVVGGCN
jgi:hypothetical protein